MLKIFLKLGDCNVDHQDKAKSRCGLSLANSFSNSFANSHGNSHRPIRQLRIVFSIFWQARYYLADMLKSVDCEV